MIKEKLKVGILTDSEYTPAWAYEMIKKVNDSPYAEISLIILNGAKQKKKGLKQKIKGRLKYLVTIIYLTLEQRLLPGSPDAFKGKSFEQLLPKVPRIIVKPRQTKFRDFIEGEDIQKIQEYNLDIILCRGFRILAGQILRLPKYGVWSYHHGDNNVNRGRPAIFWETLQRWESIGVIFQILAPELDNGKVIYRSFSGHKSRFIFKNMNAVYWKSSLFFYRAVKLLAEEGEERFNEVIARQNPILNFYDRPLYKIPGNAHSIILYLRHFFFIVYEKLYESIFYEHWSLEVEKNKGLTNSLFRFKRINIPNNEFWADPFIIEHDGRSIIYFERVKYKEGKGTIDAVELDKNGRLVGKPIGVLNLDYHLSYPFIFREDDDFYMVPESGQNRTIDLYKCTNFPFSFEFQKTLIANIHAVDSTIVKHNNKFWLFCNVAESEGMSTYDELFLYFSESLEDEWQPHPLNPIVSDSRKARPAGAIIIENNRLIRPSQICNPVYGYGVQFNEILTLTENDYKEVTLDKIEPLWKANITGVHTFNSSKNWQIIDVAKRRLKILKNL